MFYDTNLNNHGLKFNPFKSCIVPRPIAFISSMSTDGVINIAPYSYFNAVADTPPVIMFSSGYKADGTEKDTLRNIRSTHEFVVNITTYHLRNQMNLASTALPYGISEAEQFDIETLTSNIVKPPRVKLSPINLECKYIKTVELLVDSKSCSSQVVFGHVVGIHIDDSLIIDNKIDITRLQPIARLGSNQYAVVKEFFTMSKPKN